MLKSEAAVILSLPDNEFQWLFQGVASVESHCNPPPIIPFDELVLSLLSQVSKSLFANPAAKSYPDVIAFAFWIRASALQQLRRQHSNSMRFRLGRGAVFHIAPSNVPVNFAFSLAAGLLTGNVNFVRVSRRKYPQVEIIVNAFAHALSVDEFRSLAPYVNIFTSDHSRTINDVFSNLCDVRVIWGGTGAITEIRSSPLPPKAFDITFADRFSCCAINAVAFLALSQSEQSRLFSDFFNDTYLHDQNACTAPHLLCWVGDDEYTVTEAQELFWTGVLKIIEDKAVSIPSVVLVNKLTTAYKFAALNEGSRILPSRDKRCIRVAMANLQHDLPSFRGFGGLFYECIIPDLGVLFTSTSSQYQTLSYFGFNRDEIQTFLTDLRPLGIDRVVPIGKTQDFSLLWDGYDLVALLTRSVTVQ